MCFECNFFLGFAFVLGSVIGSFLNVCIYRIPARKSIVSPSSSCPQCGCYIRWYQNVPIFSYIFLRGRCAGCGQQIPLRYPLIEVIAGSLFALTFYSFGFSLVTPVYWLLLATLIVIAFIDLDHQIIPDIISLPGIGIGFSMSFFAPWIGWLDSLLGILLGGGLLLSIAWGYEFLAKREGMGGGDIKLLAMIGAFLGWRAIFPVLFLAALTGSMIGVPLMLLRGRNGRLAIPFGPFLSLGAIIYLFWGRQILYWYFSLWAY